MKSRDIIKNSTTRSGNLQMIHFSETDTSALAKLANRAMKLQINIQEGEVMVSVGEGIVYVTPAKLKRAASFTIVRRKAGYELLCVPRQSDAPRQCSHRKSCTAAASAMTKGNFGPFMTTGLPSTRPETRRSLQARTKRASLVGADIQKTLLGFCLCRADGSSESIAAI